MQLEMAPGDVWLVGAGPGSVDLLTIKAARLIGVADIIFHDALIGPDILALACPDAELINVGKRAGRHSMPQAAICDCLVEAAQAGLRVLRLKGGDPGIFGRATEEIDSLRSHDIPVHIVPGITAACAAAASAGISLTRRGDIRRLQMITAHLRDDDDSEPDWAGLADPHSVIAIYMGKSSAGRISGGLIKAGLPVDHPVLAIENASLCNERMIQSTLLGLGEDIHQASATGPMLLLIGAVRKPGNVRVKDASSVQTSSRMGLMKSNF
jgi:uroporphyrin-III C-methyltransferase